MKGFHTPSKINNHELPKHNNMKCCIWICLELHQDCIYYLSNENIDNNFIVKTWGAKLFLALCLVVHTSSPYVKSYICHSHLSIPHENICQFNVF